MRIADAIRAVDNLKANQYSAAQKVQWLSECDGNIWRYIISTHETAPGMPDTFSGYDPAKDMDRELLAPAPHDILYRHLLEMQIDLYNKDLNSYHNTSRLYNTAYAEFASWYNRTYMPRQYATHFIL